MLCRSTPTFSGDLIKLARHRTPNPATRPEPMATWPSFGAKKPRPDEPAADNQEP